MSNLRCTSEESRLVAATATFGLVEDEPGALRLVGELDLAGVPEVRDRLVEWQGDVELDCSGLTFIDASGLKMLGAIHYACARRGAKLLIVNPSPCVIRLLELTGLDALFAVCAESSAP
jgi:anti-anti-sigma factor